MDIGTNKMDTQARIRRVARMEEIYDRAVAAVERLSWACREYEALQPALSELEEYYEDGRWLSDFLAEGERVFPTELKRGILTEDAIYDLLTDRQELETRLENLCGRTDRPHE